MSKTLQFTSREALAVASAIAAGTTAYAAPVGWDNDGSLATDGDAWLNGIILNITKSPAAQPVDFGDAATIEFVYDPNTVVRYGYNYYYYPSQIFEGVTGTDLFSDFGAYAHRFDVGDLIGPGLGTPFQQYWDDRVSRLQTTAGVISPWFNEGFVGVRFMLDGQYHYGWVELALRDAVQAGYGLNDLDIVGWGYETTPGAVIAAGAVPGSGVLSVLALGAVGMLGRTRRM